MFLRLSNAIEISGNFNNDLYACGMQIVSSQKQDRKGRSKYGKENCREKTGKNANENEDKVYHICMVYVGFTSA